MDSIDLAEVAEQLIKALKANGCPNDKVIVTNFDYQGTVTMQDEFAMFGGE
jgi:hypothetical protein